MTVGRIPRVGVAAAAWLVATCATAAELCVKCTGPDANYSCVVKASSNTTVDTLLKFYCITALAKSGQHASCAIDRNSTAPCQGERRELPVPTTFEEEPSSPGSEHEAAAPVSNGPAGATLAPNSQGAPHPTQASSAGGDTGNAAAQPQGSDASTAPPKTVQEMVEKSARSATDGLSSTQQSAGDAAKSASTALEKAGTAVGDAAKSSWQCLSSFFSKC